VCEGNGRGGGGESDGEDNGHTKVVRSSFYERGMRYRFKFLNSHAVQLWHDGRTGEAQNSMALYGPGDSDRTHIKYKNKI
jgi:hypothetical protein